MCRPSSKSGLSRIYACPWTGIVICSSLLTNWWWNKCAGSRFWNQLDYVIDIIPKDWRITRREWRHQEIESPSITVCADKRCLIQKRILSTVPEVFKPRGSKLRNKRSPRGYLQKPLGGTVISTQVDQSRIPLAYNAEGHTSLCQGLQQMSKVQ